MRVKIDSYGYRFVVWQKKQFHMYINIGYGTESLTHIINLQNKISVNSMLSYSILASVWVHEDEGTLIKSKIQKQPIPNQLS